MHLLNPCWLSVPALVLVGCGGPAASSNPATTTPPRGTLLQSPRASIHGDDATLLLELNVAANQQLLTLSGPPVCDILIYHIEYETVGGANEPTTASAALMVPTGLGANCTGARPIVLYAHGTTTDRAFNMTDMQNAETLFLAALFASQGYIVVAPNYAGYDTSTLHYHPYLIADQQSKDMIDALTAARSALPFASATLTKDSGQLFITGYSQGGYVAMATHRAMQAAGMKVTASAPMSGPYALAAFVDAVFYGEVNGGAPISSTFLLTAYQRAYGNIYADAVDVFAAQYASGIDSLLPSTTPRSQLYAQGKLPAICAVQLDAAHPGIRRHYAATDAGESGRGVRARFWQRQFAAEWLSLELPAGCAGESGWWVSDDDHGSGRRLLPGCLGDRLCN